MGKRFVGIHFDAKVAYLCDSGNSVLNFQGTSECQNVSVAMNYLLKFDRLKTSSA